MSLQSTILYYIYIHDTSVLRVSYNFDDIKFGDFYLYICNKLCVVLLSNVLSMNENTCDIRISNVMKLTWLHN